jgi:membrane protease YdiL (CAAX protease family)
MMTKDKLPISKIAFAFAIVLVFTHIGPTVLGVYLHGVAPFLWNYSWFHWVFTYFPIYGVYFPLFYVFLRSIPDTRRAIIRPVPRNIQSLLFILVIAFGFGVATIINLITNLVSDIMNRLLGVGVSNPMMDAIAASDLVTHIIIVVGVAPLLEELIFRKLLYHKLIGYGPNLYILVSSLLFMSFHSNLFQMGYAFFLGLILASIYAYAEKFRYIWRFHVVFNGIGALSLLVSALIVPKVPWMNTVYVMFEYALAGIGLITGTIILVLHHKKLRFGYGSPLPIKSAKAALLNPGMITVYVIFFCIIMFTQFYDYVMYYFFYS